MRLGIDFGTTRTVVASVREGRYPVASFQTAEGFKEFLPGLASIFQGHLQLGAEVEPLPGVPLVRSVKATITGAAPDEHVSSLPGARYSALELATRYLVHVRQMLIDHSNLDIDPGEPLEAMVAVPAHASTRQRYLTLEAFTRAGFSVLGLVNEPTAGAIEFARHSLGALSPRSQKRYVVVYDLGGGTFDTAAVSLVDRHFDLLGAEGIPRLGGNNFDEIIAQLVLDQLGKAPLEVSELVMAHLLERCRHAKESLNPTSRRLLVDVAELFSVDQVVLDAAEVYGRARPLIEQTERAVDLLIGALVEHGIDPENPREMGAVYLVGGSVQFPPVQRMLRARYGRKVQLAPQPHASTAIGLAIAADPSADIYVREVPTRHFGVWREGDLGREKVFDPIIEKRLGEAQNGPVRVERVYRPAHAVGRLRFVECTSLDEEGQPQGEVTPWETILFPYDPALADRADLEPFCGGRDSKELGEEIAEVYEYTPSGIVKVSIENRTRGYRREYVLGSSVHL
jgi:molecular chaperone DnaK (HSP70)